MYVKHFLKMFFGLILMAAIGVGGLVLLNHYSKTASVNDSSNMQ